MPLTTLNKFFLVPHPITRRLRGEWLLTLVLTFLAALALNGSGWVQHLDGWLYDNLSALNSKSTHPEIVVIAIDEPSLRELGKWPWQPSLYTQLLKVLAQAHPKAVGLDVPIVETTDQVSEVEALASAIKEPALGGVVLPVAFTDISTSNLPSRPVRPLATAEQAARGLGHTRVAIDADGVARGIHWFEGPTGQASWPSMALQMAKIGNPKLEVPVPTVDRWPSLQPSNRQTSPKVLFPFREAADIYPTVSYRQVLSGNVPPEVFKDKYVLIGVTATGLGLHWVTSTLVNGTNVPTPEVYLLASGLDGLLSHTMIDLIQPPWVLMLTLSTLGIWLVSLRYQCPKSNALSLVLIMTGVPLLSALLLWWAHFWLPHGNLITCAAFAYVIWTWRLQRVQVSELQSQLTQLATNVTPPLLPITEATPRRGINSSIPEPSVALFGERSGYPPVLLNKKKGPENIEEVLKCLDSGIATTTLSHALLAETLHALPEAVLLTDQMGMILMVNTRAQQLLGHELVNGLYMTSLLLLGEPASTQYGTSASFAPASNWFDLMSQAQGQAGVEIGLKRKDHEQEAVVLVRATAMSTLGYLQALDSSDRLKPKVTDDQEGWLLVLSDITPQLNLQLQRDHALQLLSHDIRAPQSALLILIHKLESTGTLTAGQIEALERMRLQIDATFHLADDFVWLLRSQTTSYVFDEIDLISLLQQVFDRAWPLAEAKAIRLRLSLGAFEGKNLWIQAEPRLLERAVFNLVENAIKYSDPQTETEISLVWQDLEPTESKGAPKRIRVVIRDQGRGISPPELKHLFVRYRRLGSNTSQPSAPPGHGLGLALVQRVVSQHGGRLEVTSKLGIGSRFVVILPVVD